VVKRFAAAIGGRLARGLVIAILFFVAERAKISRLATWKRVARSGVAGIAATAADLATLTILVEVAGWSPRTANAPALLVGAVVNFVGNRMYAFHARAGSMAKQAIGYSVVEAIALALNGVLYEAVLRFIPEAGAWFWLVRLVTSCVVFLCWSYPLWRRVFRVKRVAQNTTLSHSALPVD
jgi:putative flippase GtrA